MKRHGILRPAHFLRLTAALPSAAFFLLAFNPAALPQNGPTARPEDRAWEILREGVTGKSTEDRAAAARALGLIAKNAAARGMVEKCLTDPRSEVRAAAATSLGSMVAKASIPKLKKALDDKDVSVALAAAQSLIALGDSSGYDLYFEILTGEHKTSNGIIDEHLKLLRQPKKMVWLGLEESMVFVPFGGIGFGAYKAIKNDDKAVARAAAAKMLAGDPDKNSGEALLSAASDKSWIVRAAALEAIAHRQDQALLPKIAQNFSDEKPEVGFIAAAAVIRLAGSATKPAQAVSGHAQ